MPVVVDHSRYSNEDYNPPKKLETDLFLTLELPNVTIKMPHSRIPRSRYSSSPPGKKWPKLIAKTYIENAVGSFAGNFDKPITSNIRCGNTILNFREFVEFRHEPGNECHAYKIDMEKYFELDDVSKMKSFKLVDDELYGFKLVGPASIKGSEYELNTIVYTCVKHECVLPCPCYLCIDEDPDECDHKILHPGFFDPNLRLFTVRNADSYDINWNEENLHYSNEYCTNRKCRGIVLTSRPPQQGFNYRMSCIEKEGSSCLCSDCPYCKSVDVIKYAGTEKSCTSCKMKLLHHESYHLVYHYMCIFCRESLHKFRNITSEKEFWDEFEERRFEEESSCHFCLRLFFDEPKKKRHIEIVHNKNPDFLFKCKDCIRSFGSKQSLKYHLETFHDHVDMKLPCEICEMSFKTNHNLDVHMRSVHGETEYACDLCYSSFSRQSNLNHHYKICHNTIVNKLFQSDDPSIFEYLECDMCGSRFREKRTLNHHVKFVHLRHEQPVLYCDSCDFETIEMKTLNHHTKMAHKKKEHPLLSCENCDFETNEIKTLNHHKRMLHGKEEVADLECKECNFTTKEAKTLNRHRKTVHTEGASTTFKCSYCEFRTKYKHNLKKHQHRRHSKSVQKRKILKCSQCEFRTLDENEFLKHNSNEHIHCEQCAFMTILPRVMGNHKRKAHKE